MSSYGRLDVVVLALMLVYLFAIVLHFCSRYYLTRRARDIDSANTKSLAAALDVQVGSLKSIAVTAPFLGLAGTCLGIWSAFSGGAMQRDALRAMIEMRIAVAIIPTVAAIPVAVLATCSYHLCIHLLEGNVFDEGRQRSRHFRGGRRLPLAKRFSELPAFGLLAVPVLAFAVAGCMTFASFHTPTGFYIELPAHTSQSQCGDFDVIVLQISKEHTLKINSEPVKRETVGTRLHDIYRLRAERLLLVTADPDISFQEVAGAIDVAHGAVKNLYVTLVTPDAEKEPCLFIVAPKTSHRSH
jgi:biopolymer transport protein ExbD